MNAETVGRLSAVWLILSIIPYAIRVYQGKITPNLTSWALWALIGLVLLLTYRSSGAESNVWPAIFGFINPCLITILILRRSRKLVCPTLVETICLLCGLCALILWYFVQEQQKLARYALYLAIIADLFAAIPTVVFVWESPHEERPVPWVLFIIGYGMAMFAISEHTVANYALPVYMVIAASNIALPLVLYRLKQKSPLKEWV